MITLLTGENNYEAEQALGKLVRSFDGEAEKYDGEELEARQLPDLLSGQSLFAEKRLVIIRGLSNNKALWEVLPEHLERMSEDIDLVLVDSSPDKRTKTFKALQKAATVKEFKYLTERDSSQAERWVQDEAQQMGVQLDVAATRELLQRSMVMTAKGQAAIDQWQVLHSLEKLSVFDSVTKETVQKYIDDQPANTVFGIFETTLKGDKTRLHQLLKELEPHEDPFRVFGLLSGQVFQLAALSAGEGSSAEVAKAIGVHPFALGKLTAFAKALNKKQIKGIVMAFVEADEDMKLSKAEPWVLIERALVNAAMVANIRT